MRRPSWRLLVPIVVVVLAVAAFVTYRATRSTQHTASGVKSDVGATIPTRGARLAAEVVTPLAPGRAPLIVMPAGWGQPATEYRAVARNFATAGYVVVAYAQRGFGKSTGAVDFAGSGSQHDVSTVITWALAHTDADPTRIGMLGISYGAGVSLLGAAHDKRIRAVAALSTWADVGAALDPGNTPSIEALALLVGGKHKGVRFDATTTRLRNTLLNRPKEVGAAVRAISKTRSPITYVKQLNQNRPAIMLANGFEDSIFPPAQLVPFFAALTTPKRLELAGGDHGGPELTELLGGTTKGPISNAEAWFDHYLRGRDNGIQTEGPIVLKDVQGDTLRSFSTWPTATKTQQVSLGIPGARSDQTGNLAAVTWKDGIFAGVDSTASSGHAQLVPGAAYVPPHAAIASINPTRAFAWIGPNFVEPVSLNGIPSVSLLLGSSAGKATVFVYLYDIATSGEGTLIDFQPYTASGGTATKPKPVRISMQPISWAVSAGDRIGLVIDAVDPRYQSLTPRGAIIAVASNPKHRAIFTAPVSG